MQPQEMHDAIIRNLPEPRPGRSLDEWLATRRRTSGHHGPRRAA